MPIPRRSILVLFPVGLIAALCGCNMQPPDPAPSKAFVEDKTPAAASPLPEGVSRATKRGRTFAYWSAVARDFRPCVASEAAKPENVYTGYVQQEVLKNIGDIPVKGVDEDAVKAISLLLNASAADADINAKNTQEAVNKAGAAAGTYMSTPNNGQFGGSLDAAGAAVGGSVVSAMNTVTAEQAARKSIDAKIDSARRLLEARYGDSYPAIQIGDNTCLSIKFRWK